MTLKHPHIAIGILCLVLGVAAYGLSSWSARGSLNLSRCLNENEEARYEIVEKGDPGVVRVTVWNTQKDTPEWSRDFPIPSTSHVGNHQLSSCHIYIHERVGYDVAARKVSPGYYWSLKRYPYFSTSADAGETIVTFLENPTGKRGDEIKPTYGTQFAVSSDERYISLERSILGDPDYALVIRNLETGEDEFELTLDALMRDHPNAAGSFSVGKWVMRPDGEYLLTETYDGAREPAFIRVKAESWQTDIFDSPRDVLSGVERAMPPFAPYLAYTDLTTFAGFQQVADAILDERIASGEPKRLLLADLRSGKTTLLEAVEVVRGHRWDLAWKSDTELEYTMPDGTRKSHRVE